VIPPSHATRMFSVSEADAAAIRTAFDRSGELSAVVALRRLFPGVTDNAQARGMRPDHRGLEAAICAATAGQAGPRQVALADAWRRTDRLQWSTIKNMAPARVLTLPAVMIVAGSLYGIQRQMF
jgi:phosphate/sulfate permease